MAERSNGRRCVQVAVYSVGVGSDKELSYHLVPKYFFSTCFQNTALNLAAANGHAALVTYFLSMKEQEILLNKSNQNVLDLAISSEKEEVAMAIIEHSR